MDNSLLDLELNCIGKLLVFRWELIEECAFFTSDVYNNHNLWSCQKVCDALVYLLDNILLDFELNLIGKLLIFRWELIVLLLLKICFFFVMRDFMMYLSRENLADIIEAFNSTSRYLDDL